jgi:oligogalacturonide lyase
MAYHNYKLEPNERFSPDDKEIIFTSNMFGPSYVFAVGVEKAVDPPGDEVFSTPALAEGFSPKPPPTPFSDQW